MEGDGRTCVAPPCRDSGKRGTRKTLSRGDERGKGKVTPAQLIHRLAAPSSPWCREKKKRLLGLRIQPSHGGSRQQSREEWLRGRRCI
jgi:hypothetical protein